MATKEQTLFTITAASKELKVSRQTIYGWLTKGKLYAIEIGGVRFIPLEAIKNSKTK